MVYTIGEMAKRLGIAPSTLRYYDKEGLLPFVERSSGGIRTFKESDYEWLQIIECLKKTGMRLKDVKTFVEMAMQGDRTIEPRLELIVKQKQVVEEKIAELNEILRTLQFKEWYYTSAKEHGTTEILRAAPIEDIPKRFQAIRLKLRGE